MKNVCPICGNTDLIYQKKGFSVAKVIVLTVLTFGIFGIWALIAGLIGKNKIQVICKQCGHKWKL